MIFLFDPTAIATDKLKPAEVFERPEKYSEAADAEADVAIENRPVLNTDAPSTS